MHISRNGITQEAVALLWTVTLEGFCGSHGIHALMKALDGEVSKRECNVTDTKTDDLRVRMLSLVGSNPVRRFQAKR